MSSRREGFTIIEVVVAIVLLSIILTSLAAMTFHTAQQALHTSDTAARDAAALETVNRFSVLPYSGLSAAQGCDTTSATGMKFKRCVTVTNQSNTAVVSVVTTPLGRNVAASTVTFRRVPPAAENPLCSGC